MASWCVGMMGNFLWTEPFMALTGSAPKVRWEVALIRPIAHQKLAM
jgi:hypothetical protein